MGKNEMTGSRSQAEIEQVCTELFGEKPEDVITPLDSAADAFLWIKSILGAIKSEAASGDGDQAQIQYLAEAGAYICESLGGYVDSQYQAMISNLRDHGLAERPAKADA